MAHEKEMLGVLHCLRTWTIYLLGVTFVVHTDNVANTFFATQPKLLSYQVRWQEQLVQYDMVWQHKLGRSNIVPNALSRLAAPRD